MPLYVVIRPCSILLTVKDLSLKGGKVGDPGAYHVFRFQKFYGLSRIICQDPRLIVGVQIYLQIARSVSDKNLALG